MPTLLIGIKGTIPFMSVEVMQTHCTLAHSWYGPETQDFTHHALHDVEFFFWVLLYLCLARKGPGGAHRDELDYQDNPSDETKTLQHVIYCLSDSGSDNVAENKRVLFAESRDVIGREAEEEAKGPMGILSKKIIPSIHPYFEDLQDLIKDWFHLLQRAHRFRLAEGDTIYDQTLELIEGTLAKIEEKERLLPEGAPEHELTIKERERRRKEISRICEAFHDH